MALTAAAARGVGPAASGSPTSGRPSSCGTVRRSSRSAPAIVWQDRRTAERCRALRDAGDEPMIRDGPASCSIPISPPPSSSGCSGPAHARRPSARARGGHGRYLARRPAHRWARSTSPTHQRSRTLLCRLADADWDPRAAGALLACRARMLPEIVPSSGVVRRPTARASRLSLPIAGSPGTSRRRSSARAARRGMAKNTYGTGAFLLMHAGTGRPPARGLLTTVGLRPPHGEPAYALEGSVFIAGAAIQWLRDGPA